MLPVLLLFCLHFNLVCPLHLTVDCNDVLEDTECKELTNWSLNGSSRSVKGLHVLCRRESATHTSSSSMILTWHSPWESGRRDGFIVVIDKKPRYASAYRRCFVIEERRAQSSEIEWHLDCPNLLRLETGSYNVSVRVHSPADAESQNTFKKSTIFITEKLGDLMPEYARAPAFWATDIIAAYDACTARLVVSFEAAPSHYRFTKYEVKILSERNVIQSDIIDADPKSHYITHHFTDVQAGRYNISVAAVETSRSKSSCVCQCSSLEQENCYSLPGCPSWARGTCLVSKSAYLYATPLPLSECRVVSEALRVKTSTLTAIVCGCIGVVALLSVLVVTYIWKETPFLSVRRKGTQLPVIEKSTARIHVTLYYWGGQTLPIMRHLRRLLQDYCACDVIIEDPLDQDYSDDVIQLNKNEVTMVVFSDIETQDEFMAGLDDSIIVVRVAYTSAMASRYRRVYTLPEDLQSLCYRLHNGSLPKDFHNDFLLTPHAVALQAMLLNIHNETLAQAMVSRVNERFNELESEYSMSTVHRDGVELTLSSNTIDSF